MELAVGLVGGFLLGILGSTIAWVISEYLARPLLALRPDTNRAQGHSQGAGAPHEFYHVLVTNQPSRWPVPGRRPAWACTADIEVFREDGSRAVQGRIIGRWTSQPEPVLPVVSNGQVGGVVDPARLIQARRMDVHCHATESMSIAVKYEGDPECYIFTNESYVFPGWRNPDWRLGPGRYRLRVTVYYERGVARQDFELNNAGPRRDDLRIAPWPGV